MKHFYLVFILSLAILSCKNDATNDADLEENRSKSYNQNDGLITMRGEFVYYADAAVFQTPNEIYGVVVDDKMHLLNEKVKAFKTEATDMVPVTVRVKKFEKPENEEGWQYRVEIKEILKVETPNPDKKDVIKLAN
ncbi:MAG: hypothetical protein HKN40_11340 [Winogradskyella sp.]|uniref:hypothetical protein n=1 Tax=Winogradskyella sp. TaxID=1883156 RepID=UPI0017AE1CC1|nr:hypothetical protein [Winogradskyella sp.]